MDVRSRPILVGSGGAAGGALAPAFAVLARFFLPILREIGRWSLPLGAAGSAKALADEGQCKVYVSAWQTSRHTQMSEVTAHIQEAQANGSPSIVQFFGYKSSTKVFSLNIEFGDDSGADRTWYNKEQLCSVQRRDSFGRPADCDEYPFYSTVQGAYLGMTERVSVKLVTRRHNRAQGGTLAQFYRKCHVSANDPFEVRTNTAENSYTYGALPNGTVCYGGNANQ